MPNLEQGQRVGQIEPTILGAPPLVPQQTVRLEARASGRLCGLRAIGEGA